MTPARIALAVMPAGRQFQRQLADVRFEDGLGRAHRPVLREWRACCRRAGHGEDAAAPVEQPGPQAILHPIDQRVAHDVGGGFELLLVDHLSRAPASGLSAPKASECISTRSVPGGSRRGAAGSARRSLCRFSSSAALQLKNCALAAQSRGSSPALRRRAAACRAGPYGRRKCSCRRAPVPARWPRRSRCWRPESGPRVVCSYAAHVSRVTSISLSSSSHGADADLGALGGHQLRKALAPLDQHQGVAVEDLVQPERGHLRAARPGGRDRCDRPRRRPPYS